jgi:hypothetical protein
MANKPLNPKGVQNFVTASRRTKLQADLAKQMRQDRNLAKAVKSKSAANKETIKKKAAINKQRASKGGGVIHGVQFGKTKPKGK